MEKVKWKVVWWKYWRDNSYFGEGNGLKICSNFLHNGLISTLVWNFTYPSLTIFFFLLHKATRSSILQPSLLYSYFVNFWESVDMKKVRTGLGMHSHDKWGALIVRKYNAHRQEDFFFSGSVSYSERRQRLGGLVKLQEALHEKGLHHFKPHQALGKSSVKMGSKTGLQSGSGLAGCS